MLGLNWGWGSSISSGRFGVCGLFSRGLAVALMTAVFNSPVEAQLSPQRRRALAEQVLAAKSQLDPAALPDLPQAQRSVRNQIAALDLYLQRHTSESNRRAWFEYLQIEDLTDVLGDDDQLREQAQQAGLLRFRLSRNFDGLQMLAMRGLRRAVADLQAAIRFRNPDRSIEGLADQLDKLAARLRDMAAVPSPDDAASISIVLSLLEDAGQVADLRAELRQAFEQPNVRTTISERLIQRVASQPVNRQQAVNDCLLGTRLKGCAWLNGSVQAALLASSDDVRIQLTLSGKFFSRNVGYNGPVSVNTTGRGHVLATRVLLLNESGIRFEPTFAEASLDSEIESINHPLRIVRKIAAKRAAEQQPLAERISVKKLQRQIGGEFDQQTDALSGTDLSGPLAEVEKVFERVDVSLPTRQLYATDETIFLDLRLAEASQVLATTAPPPLRQDRYIGVQIHESAINNVATQVLAGRTMNRKQLNQLIENLRPESGLSLPTPFVEPTSDKPTSDKPTSEEGATEEASPAEPTDTEPNGNPSAADAPPAAFEIDFARLRPLVFEARDGTIRIGVRGTRFQQGRTELKRAIEITATYKPVYFEDKIFLMREGNVDVDYPGGRRMSVSEVAIKTNIRESFAEAFPKALLNRPIELPIERIGGLTIYPRSISAEHGWLSVGLE